MTLDGVLIIDKPTDWTSHDVVNKVRRIAATKRVGHLGTLDPIATGVLPLVVGRATRLAQYYTRSDKIYEATIRFGFSTTSYDRAGETVGEVTEPTIDAAELERCLQPFRGEFLQTPPQVSAKKVAGVRGYEAARKGVTLELPAAPVHVYELELLECSGAIARVRAHCSGGTYMRSIAHEIGQAMGCGAHLTELRRTRSGEFEIANARTLEQLAALAAEDRLRDALVSAAEMLPAFPVVLVDELVAGQIRNGCNFPASPFRAQPAAKLVKAVTRDGELVAIGEAVLPNLYHPAVVL